MAAPRALGAALGGGEDGDGGRGGAGAVSNEDGRDCILEPLSLPEGAGHSGAPEGSPSVPCIFCEEHFPTAQRDPLLKHMIIEHKLVIADVRLVADFRRYVLYWRRRFREQPVTDFCSVIRINSAAPLEEQDSYFLLCDVLPEDRVLREELQAQRLKGILEQQQRERNDNSFHGICMFCNEEFLGNRSVLLNHMAREHAFNIGLPDNIVNCGEFLSTLQRKLDKNLENRGKRFSRKTTGSCWSTRKSETRAAADGDWSDWEERPVSAVCLFCEKQAETTEQLCAHMEEAHGFDLLKTKAELGLNFYEQVKLVNFIRRQVHQGRCYGCCARFPSRADLGAHLAEANHAALLPDRRTWDQPEYYFPTYENDGLLCTLSDSEGDLSAPGQSRGVTVIGEDTSQLQALRQSSVLNRLLPRGWEG
ncbi:zinc finger protein 277 isoform X3 [Eptesicus fuscus]|uniref:zinc finger protein 277 isoform X3 n=1 Tax=Eptesicus fuscus TaxID=29078 RepID=UPI00240430AB|nr:zinc finger protein 277 isoform X3 [Eptesicus fuscus]